MARRILGFTTGMKLNGKENTNFQRVKLKSTNFREKNLVFGFFCISVDGSQMYAFTMTLSANSKSRRFSFSIVIPSILVQASYLIPTAS